ncbi:Uncharacterised protein [uncultured archaeon]|nr:Uncharacterised protein [uncultured archaeon]
MTTTIKVSDETKQRLDMIQAKITLARRRKVTLMELIDTMTQIALRHEDELLQIEKPQRAEKNPDMPVGRRGRSCADKADEYVYEE